MPLALLLVLSAVPCGAPAPTEDVTAWRGRLECLTRQARWAEAAEALEHLEALAHVPTGQLQASRQTLVTALLACPATPACVEAARRVAPLLPADVAQRAQLEAMVRQPLDGKEAVALARRLLLSQPQHALELARFAQEHGEDLVDFWANLPQREFPDVPEALGVGNWIHDCRQLPKECGRDWLLCSGTLTLGVDYAERTMAVVIEHGTVRAWDLDPVLSTSEPVLLLSDVGADEHCGSFADDGSPLGDLIDTPAHQRVIVDAHVCAGTLDVIELEHEACGGTGARFQVVPISPVRPPIGLGLR